MRDTCKEPLPRLCPRPQDFRRHISGVRWPAMKRAPDNYHRQRSDAPSAHRRPGYPLSGCVPAEPDSVSPGIHTLAARSRVRKYPSAPELCLKNPNRFEKASKWVQILSEEPIITHSLCRRPCKRSTQRAQRAQRKVIQKQKILCALSVKAFVLRIFRSVDITAVFRTRGLKRNYCWASVSSAARRWSRPAAKVSVSPPIPKRK
jgi:hypothetical protein